MRIAYYFQHHTYTMVPRHIAEDMAWLADHGFEAVACSVIETDITAARANFLTIGREAERRGLRLLAVPSRWGGLVAGAPKVPSLWASMHPETWMRNADGTPAMFSVSGPMCSLHHPAVAAFFAETLGRVLRELPFTGIVWDEPKMLDRVDHGPEAVAALGARVADPAARLDAATRFFGEANAAARAARPGLWIGMHLYAHLDGEKVARLARTPGLDAFGCDGRPWAAGDREAGGEAEDGKLLLSDGPRFIAAARAAGVRSYCLIENHNLPADRLPLMERRLPETLAMGWDDVIAYYYPRNVERPDEAMAIIGAQMRALAGRG